MDHHQQQYKDLIETSDDLLSTALTDQSQAKRNTTAPDAIGTNLLQRENDSLDDFEHLEAATASHPPSLHPINTPQSVSDSDADAVKIPSTIQIADLLDMGADLVQKSSNMDLFSSDLPPPPVPPHGTGDYKYVLHTFMQTERQAHEPKERILDSEPELERDKPSSVQDFQPETKSVSALEPETKQDEAFKDVIEESMKEMPKPGQEPESKKEPVQEIVPEPISLPKKPAKKEVIGAEAIFCKMGLDAWFNPERLNPRVESLIYWRNPRKSGIVFGGTLIVLLSLAYFSLISVVAYLSLFALAGAILFRIYKNVLQAVQKTSDGHPFKELLDADVTLPQDKVKEVTEIIVAHINAAVTELRRLFLVEDLVDSIKFGVFLWCLTYLGSWFNGMTIVIIAFVALFTLPKVYENNKTQIDANLDIVRTKLAEITSKVKAAIPIGKKTEEKKEQ